MPRKICLPVQGMLAHAHPFRFAEIRGLVQDGIGHADLADVVQQRAELKGAHLLARQLQLAPQTQAETDDTLRMPVRFPVAGFQRGGQRLQVVR
jgi:hypothetical protein